MSHISKYEDQGVRCQSALQVGLAYGKRDKSGVGMQIMDIWTERGFFKCPVGDNSFVSFVCQILSCNSFF